MNKLVAFGIKRADGKFFGGWRKFYSVVGQAAMFDNTPGYAYKDDGASGESNCASDLTKLKKRGHKVHVVPLTWKQGWKEVNHAA